jgi:hypothetical protein
MSTSPGTRPDQDVIAGDLCSLTRERSREALNECNKARRKAERHHAVKYITGILGVLAGGLAGAAVFADAFSTEVQGFGAFVASAAAGAQTVLRSQTLADQHGHGVRDSAGCHRTTTRQQRPTRSRPRPR